MKKQVHNQIFKSVLLLLSVLLLIAGAAVNAFANTPLERDLTLTFDADVKECVIEVKNTPGDDWTVYLRVTESGTVSVPYDKNVRLTVVPVTGKWPQLTVQSPTTHNTLGNTVTWSPYKENASVSIQCTDRKYVIYALNYDQSEDIEYATVEGSLWTIEELKNGSVEYQYGSEALTELPVVEKEDYTFHGWNIKMGEGENDFLLIGKSENGKYYIPKDLTRTHYFDTNNFDVNRGTIYVYPDMRPVEYDVYREDRVYNSDISGNLGEMLFGAVSQKAPVKYGLTAMEKDFWNDDPAGDYKQYQGYRLMTEYPYPDPWPVGEPPLDKPHYNTVYRFYMPIDYTLIYDLNDGGDVTTVFNGPETYTYATPTVIGIPARRGYTFVKWNVQIYNASLDQWQDAPALVGENCTLGDKKATYDATTRNDPNAVYASDAQANGAHEIRFVAEWAANKYEITYNWGDGVSADLIQNQADFLINYKEFEFDKVSFIPDPIRAGYTFMGWTLTYTNGSATTETEGLTQVEGGYNLNGALFADHITLTAVWEAETYNVTLSGQADAPLGYTTQISGVVFDSQWTIPDGFRVPTRVGYDFDGYWSGANGTGKQYIDKDGNIVVPVWDLDGENGSVTLYAKWNIKQYEVVFNTIQKIPADKEVIITVLWDGGNQSAIYANAPILLDYNTEFYVVITMPAGFEIVTWNVESFTPNGNVFTSCNIILGAENMTFDIEARPSAPVLGGDVKEIGPVKGSDTEIKIQFADATIAARYEVAISLNDDITQISDNAWMLVANGLDSYTFDGLEAGTYYYVFVRLKAIEGETLSGLALVKRTTTEYDEYMAGVIDHLNGLLNENDGDIALGVIESTIDKIQALKDPNKPLPENFQELVQQWIDEATESLVFARLQDAKIAALQNHREDCMASGSFSQENKVLLNSLCANAVSAISAATNPEDVEAIFNTAKADMEAVPVTYLYDASGAMQLTTLLGLHQNSGIVLNSIEDIQALRRAISDAIAAGKITADSFITIEEAMDLIRTLDTVSAYNFYLINVQPIDGDSFVFRMTIPEALAERTGLQVAYYNAATGMVELLETTVEGNTLVFRAKQVADFVILADPTLDLSGVIIALGVIVLCQLIAIALVLVARSKAKNAVQHASVALPVFLTIHFLPANAELIALGLGIAALVLQIVLMWLLISSGMIRVFRIKRSKSDRGEVTAVVREEDLQEDPTAVFADEDETSVPQEEPSEEEALDEDAFDEELAQELAREQDEEEVYEEVYEEEEYEELAEETFAEETEEVAELEEVYDDEEFIEHPEESYYSLDDEEDAYAYIQEETERVSDVDAADQETEETPQDRDPLDGVFGDAYVQNGTDGDEGERPLDENAYGESYEYGNEADASYAETEIADREETSGEGSVDATAYIVNEEELSEEEEMYRYDE